MKGDYRMITASEARDNVKMYKEALYTTTKNALQPVLKTISKGIEFHSRAGLSETTFYPFEVPELTTVEMKITAKQVYQNVLSQKGFTIVENNWIKNVLKIRW